MKISYVLVTYNEQCDIAESLRSIFNQVVDVELIVIDDGSTDCTQEILETFRSKIEETGGKLILRKTNKGAAYRRNQGNKLASGDVIAVCDAEEYSKNRSEAIHELFTKRPDTDVMYSAYSIRSSKNLFHQHSIPVVEWDFKSKCTISHPTVAYRKEIAIKHPYICKSKHTDLFEFMLLDAHNSGAKFTACQNILMLKIEGNSNRDKKKAKILKNEMYEKYEINLGGKL